MTDTDQVAVELRDGSAAAPLLDEILPTYEEVYAEPPYCEGPRDVADFIERFHRQAERPGFRMAIARAGGDVVGFTFGYLLPADTQWWTGALAELPEGFTREDGERTFVIIELAVLASWRRRGVARQLHETLLDGQAVERVTLTMRPEPDAAPAQAAYAAWGYRTVGQTRPWNDAPVYDSMVLDLR
jgi:GNAT superfamily N-acetyltransferase